MADSDERDDKPSAEPLADGAEVSAQDQAAKLAASCDRAMSAVGDMALMLAAIAKIQEAQLFVAGHDAAIAELRDAAAATADEHRRAEIAAAMDTIKHERADAVSVVDQELAKARALADGAASV